MAEQSSCQREMPREKAKGKGKALKKTFVRSDEEVELLLACALEYKTEKEAQGVDWESVRSKYGDIKQLYVKCVEGTGGEDSVSLSEDIQERRKRATELTKETVASKLKNVRQKYREAVDSGRRSGHGRVIMLYFDACQKIWGGCPATQEIPCGVETAATNVTSPELDDSVDNVSVASLSSSEEDMPTTTQTPRAQIV